MGRWWVFAGGVLGTIFCAAILSAQMSSAGATGQDPAAAMEGASAVQFIPPAELKKLIDAKADIAIVDDAPEEAFKAGHIPGAINFPWAPEIKPPVNLPRNKMLVLYCPCTHDEDSIDTAGKLREFGYLNTKVLEGGWFKWEELKYPIEATDASPSARAPDPPLAITSGRQVGEVTPSFRVLDVTGKYKGEKTCYVCEYGNAPTVIAFFQSTGDQTADLIVKLDQLVQQQASKNLNGVAVLVQGPESKLWLEKLASDKRIKIPLVVLQNGPKDLGVSLYHINLEATNTILVNNKRQVFANFVNVKDGNFQKVADASARMLGGG